MSLIDQYGLPVTSDPKNCMECEWHNRTFSPLLGYHTYWSDWCEYLRHYFSQLHIILLGEFRALSQHDEEDLEHTFPYECPYYNGIRAFWEIYGRIKMDWEIFIYECAMHPDMYYGFYVYALAETLLILVNEIPSIFDLKYIQVAYEDIAWFKENFGERSVLLSMEEPTSWKAPVGQ